MLQIILNKIGPEWSVCNRQTLSLSVQTQNASLTFEILKHEVLLINSIVNIKSQFMKAAHNYNIFMSNPPPPPAHCTAASFPIFEVRGTILTL